jgi:hypothetical protein
MVWMVVSFVVPQGGRTVELLAGRATWDKTGRKLGGGLRKKTGRTKETWFLSEAQHDLDILLFKHMDVHDPFRSKSSEIQLKKSNWIWIIPNPIPGLAEIGLLHLVLWRQQAAALAVITHFPSTSLLLP